MDKSMDESGGTCSKRFRSAAASEASEGQSTSDMIESFRRELLEECEDGYKKLEQEMA